MIITWSEQGQNKVRTMSEQGQYKVRICHQAPVSNVHVLVNHLPKLAGLEILAGGKDQDKRQELFVSLFTVEGRPLIGHL
jgi:hypothetical protein